MMMRLCFAVAGLVLALLVAGPSIAHAQNQFSYLAGGGVGGNFSCSSPVSVDGQTGPCRNFVQAIPKTADRGSIVCVEPAFYTDISTATIDKSLVIDCQASGGGNDILQFIINAPGKYVRIRNMSINAFFSNLSSIDIVAAASVELDNVTISGNTATAIYDHRAGPGKLAIRNSVIVGNSGPGIVVAPTSGILTAVLDNVSVRESTYGLAVGIGGRVMVSRSVFSFHSVAGIEADPGGIIELSNTLVSNNPTGVIANGGSSISIFSSGINSNNTGISGATRSYGNNRFFANATSDGTTPTPVGGVASENGLR